MERLTTERYYIGDLEYAVHHYGKRAAAEPVIVHLHGFMGDARAFRPLNAYLAPSFHCIGIDLLGHGASSHPHEATFYHEQKLTAHLTHILTELAMAPLILHGYSMGGRLALRYALTSACIADALILESTNPGIAHGDDRARRRQEDEERAQALITDADAFLDHWKTLALFQPPGPVMQQQAAYASMQQEQDPRAMAAVLRGFGTGTMPAVTDEQLQSLALPVLLAAGTADEKYRAISKAMCAALPRASLAHIHAGHRVHLDNPATLASHITTFTHQQLSL